MKGGGFLKSTITSILPIAGAFDGFRNFIDNNKSKTVETYIPTEQNINLEKSEENNSEKKY